MDVRNKIKGKKDWDRLKGEKEYVSEIYSVASSSSSFGLTSPFCGEEIGESENEDGIWHEYETSLSLSLAPTYFLCSFFTFTITHPMYKGTAAASEWKREGKEWEGSRLMKQGRKKNREGGSGRRRVYLFPLQIDLSQFVCKYLNYANKCVSSYPSATKLSVYSTKRTKNNIYSSTREWINKCIKIKTRHLLLLIENN